MNTTAIEALSRGEKLIFKKGDYIIRQGQPFTNIYYLSSGTCIRNSVTSKGDVIVYDTRIANGKAGCLLGALALYTPQVNHSTNFVAKTECICYRISRENFIRFLNVHVDVLHELMYIAMDRYDSLDKNFQSKQKGCIANRVCSFIMENLVQKNNNELWLNTSITNSDISRYLGAHRVTIIKIMKKLEEDGLIRRSAQGVQIINEKRMQAYARDEGILNYYKE